jgi:predicted nucleic acid-binding protein
VAAFASWHEGHEAAQAVLVGAVRLPAHVALEVLSVLTRLPPPHRANSAIVVDFIEARFREPLLTPPGSVQRKLMREASEHGITGGSLYDALVAATTRHAGATLLTRDRRAVRVYEALGARYQLVS